VAFSDIVSTLRLCADEAVGAQETAYLAALETATAYEMADGFLTIAYDGGMLTFAAAENPTAALLCTPEAPRPASGWRTCQSMAYGFAVDVPPEADLVENSAQSARADLPFAAGTNLSEKYLALAAGTIDGQECASPLAAGRPPESVTTETVEIGGTEFFVQQGQEGAAGSTYDFTAYATQRGATCVSLTFVLRSHTPELEPTPPPEFDRDAEAAVFEEIVGTFRWLDEVVEVTPEPIPAEARLPGIIDFYNDGTQGVVTAPETAQAGEPFSLTISTFGGGCDSAGDTSVVMEPDGATVLVYDFTAATGPDVVCPAILNRLDHTVTLQFDAPGEKTIRVWGRRVGADTPVSGVPTVIEHQIVVN